MLDILKNSLEAFAAGRFDDLKALVTDDIIYEELATQTRVQGVESFLDVLRGWRRAFPDATAEVRSGFASGDQVVAEVEWRGTQRGPLEGPSGTIPATNKEGGVRAVIIMTLKNGKIAEEHHYFDMLALLRGLGVAPSIGAVPQPAAKPGAEAPLAH